MHDDDVMDALLRKAMAADVPRLSPGFDAKVMRRTRPRRLEPAGRAVMALYVIAATGVTLWAMRDVRVELVAASVGIAAGVATGASAYVRRLAFSD